MHRSPSRLYYIWNWYWEYQ